MSQVEVKNVRKSRFGSFVALLGVLSAFGAMSAQAQNYLINKKFVDAQGIGANQVNVLGPNQSTFLEFNFFNSSTGNLTGSMTDTLPAGLQGDTTFTPVITDYAGVVNGSGCGPATINVTASAITVSGFDIPAVAAAGINPDCRIVVKVKGNPAGVGNVSTNVTNTVPSAATGATGPGGPYNSDTFSATVLVQPRIDANLSKSFNPASVPVGGNSVLTFTITNNASYDLHNVTLTDPVPATVVPQAGTAGSTCGGTVTIVGQNVTLSGGTIPASGSCNVTVTVKGTVGGNFTNTIPASTMTTTEGVTNTTLASAPLTVLDTLVIAKTHNYSSGVSLSQGQTFVVELTFTNYSVDQTNSSITDNLPAGVVLPASITNAYTDCGNGAGMITTGVPGGSTVTFSGFTVPGANLSTGQPGSCSISFMAKLTASSGTLTNTVLPANFTSTQGKVPAGPASATVTAGPAPGPSGAPGGGNWGTIEAYKAYIDSSALGVSQVERNAPFWLVMAAYNPNYDWRFTNGAMTDTLPVGLLVDVPGGAGPIALTPGTNVIYQGYPGQPNQGPNSLTSQTSTHQGCVNTGLVTVNRVAVGAGFQDTITYSTWTTESGSANWVGTPYFDGTGCWFSLQIKGVEPGQYDGLTPLPHKPINTIPAGNITTTQGVTNPTARTAPVTILSDVSIRKTFNSYVVGPAGGRTRLTVTLNNKSSVPQTGAALTDTLPTGPGWSLTVAATPNATTTCAPGTVTAVPGAGSFSIAGATIPPGTVAIPGTCSFSADILVTGPASSQIDNIILPGALTTSTPGQTNVVEARAVVLTRARDISINKVFGNGGAAQGGSPVPLTITLTGDQWPFNNVGFTDNLISIQPGLVIAPNPNASTTCRQVDSVRAPFEANGAIGISYQSTVPATITAVPGTTTLALSNAYFVGSAFVSSMPGSFNSCTLTVDVVATTTGNKDNNIPANNVTTREGPSNTSPTTATLTVQPNTQLVKSFTPTTVAINAPFTLTLTVFNVNTSPQTNFFITDTLPAGIIADSIASNTCGGTASVLSAGTVIDLPVAGTSIGPNASCAIVVNVHATAKGAFTNDQNNLNTSVIINKTTTTTVTVPNSIDLTIAKTITSSAPYIAGTSSVTYSLVAKNNGPDAAAAAIVVKDKLPAGLTAVSAVGTNWTCTPQTGAAVEIVCTRAAGAGPLGSGVSADPINVTASVDLAATGSLVNRAQVNPAATETGIETNLLGTTNGGYEDGSPTTGSNNDDSKSITLGALYSVGNRVWNDNGTGGGVANDGIQNGTEPGIDGVTVELLDGVTNAVIGSSTSTAAGGYYRFDNLAAGDYKVRITKPVGFVNTTVPGSGATPNNDTDRDNNGATQTATTVTSNVVTLGPLSPEPINESDLVGGAAPGNAAANGGLDANGNMTVDFGLVERIDLTIAKTVTSAGPYTPGISTVTYSLVATNNGPATAQAAIVIKDKLPAGLTAVSAVGTNWTCTPQTGAAVEIVCTRAIVAGTLGSGASAAPITVTATVDVTATGTLVNTAQVNPSATETIPESNLLGTTNTGYEDGSPTTGSNNDDSKPITVAGLTYSVGNRVWNDNGAGGGTANDGIQNGTEPGIDGVTVELLDGTTNAVIGSSIPTAGGGYYRFDNLPAGDYKVRITKPAGFVNTTVPGSGATPNGNLDRDNNGSVNAATTVTSAVVTLGPLMSEPTLESDLVGGAAAGNAAANGGLDATGNMTVDFGLVERIDLTIAKTVTSAGPYTPGISTVTYSLVATNNGPATAQAAIVIKDKLPAGLTAVSAVGTNWTCTPQTGAAVEIVCTRAIVAGTLGSGASAAPITVTATVDATATGSLINTAQVNPSATETIPESNLLGTTNSGYEDGSPTTGSNNDDSKPITIAGLTYSVGNRVWNDNGAGGGTANDGIQNGTEPGIDGVTVELLDGTTNAVIGSSIPTAGGGYYRFDNLPAGDYKVRITKPAGFVNTTVPGSGATPNGNLDRDNNGAADAATTVTSNVVTLGPLLVEPINESDLVGGAAAGNAAANGGLDATGNMTVDFGLVQRIDLTIAKTITSAGPYTAGASNVTYSLVATNLGPATAQAAIVVKDKLPAGLTAVSATGTNWTCAPTTGAAVEIVCTRAVGAGTLASGASADPITVTASVDATATGSLVNVAQVNPSATETIPESIPLGTTNTGYETGNPAVGSNNDDSKTITVTAATYSLGNRIWFDTNNDGILNNGETPAAGVKVQLLDSAGVPVVGQAVLTDSTGYYRFDGLNAGTYAAQVTPDNWTGISGSLPVGTTGSALVVLSGSTPLAGYQSSTGATAPNNTDHGIDPAGTYAAAGVKSANVTLGIGLQPTGEVDAGATGAGGNATLGDAFDNLTVDFGFYRLTVGDTVWLDNGAGVPANYNNGIREAGEPVIQGVTVQLLKGATVVAVTTTDGGGNYIFTQQTNGAGAGTGEPLVAGTDYTINIPAGQTVLAGTKSSATPASQPAVNSVDKITLDDGDKGLGIASADSTATASAAFTLGVSSTGASANANNTYGRAQTNVDNGTSHKPDMDFGFVPSFALGNRVWYDTNNNGVIDAAEQPINGVLVELTNSAGAKLYRTSSTDNTPTTTVTAGLAIEQTTANGGYYLFDNLPAGTFRVRVAASNWGSGQSLAGYANSTSATNAGASFVATDNNKDHGTDPTGTAAQQAAAYTANGVSSADILLGSSTVGTGDTTETGATIGTPPTSAAGNVNDNLTIDFGFYRLSVGNLVWSDSGSGGGVYNDGIRNGTEPGLDGVTVQLVDSNGNVVAQTLTSGGGNYSFNQLTSVPAVGTAGTPNGQPILPGNYTINIPPNQTPIAGATSSADTAGGRTNADSQDNGVGIALTTAATTSTAVALTPGGTAIGSTPNQVNGTTDQPRMDFGFAPGFAIGNRVWYDTNNNGVLDAGEVTVPNVLVELLDGNGVVIQTKATGPTGEYIFESLGTGNYTVRVAKENWIGITAGQVTAAGSPAGLAAGQKPLAGYNNSTGAGALTGTTTTDATDKGVDAADPTVAGISSATITLGAGLQPLNESATGDNDGVGSTTSIDANNNMTIDFGFYKLSVGDLVWKDDGNAGATPANINNGIFDAGEAGISGVRVELYKGTTLVAVTTTDGSGNYMFMEGSDGAGVPNGKPLVPGTDYQVRIPQATASVNTPLINLLSSAAAAASETTPLGVNSDDSGVGTAAASAGVTPSVNFTLGAGAASGANSIPTNATGATAQPNVDFGFAPSYSLGNRVWVDTNNDGLLNNAEVGLVGVTVTLLDGTGTPVPGVATQTTDSSGYYRFDNLPAGNYRVEIAPPPVNGVNYVSSTGQNASATGPYEAGLTSAATGTNNNDHGTQATPTTIRSGVVAVGPTALINGEVDAAAANAGANGPNGDAFDVLTVDFGIFLPAKLGNLVWFDVNKNGTADPAEPGLNNVSVILRDVNGVEIARQLTRNNPDTGNPGFYQFDYLIPGQYRVEFSAPGYFGTTPGTPSITSGTGPDTNNSQIQIGRDLGTTQLVTLAPGDNNPQLDAGYIVPPVEVPTLSELMKLLLAMMMLSIGVIAVRTRQR